MGMDPGDTGENLAFGAGSGVPAVVCPHGHANNWDYKFCGQCGAPIGVMAWPEEESEVAERRSGTSRRWALIGSIGLVVVAAVVGLLTFLIARPADGGRRPSPKQGAIVPAAPSTAAAPASCSSAPDLQPESIDMTPNGLQVKAAFSSSCGDDVETNSAVVITVVDGRRDIAAGVFDFTDHPMVMSRGGPVHRTLVFPAGMYWRTPDMVADAPTLVATRTGHPESSAREPGTGDPSTMTATEGAEPTHGSADEVSGEVLEEIRDADLPTVRELLHTWLPQISSKRVGLVANGKTWSNADILRDHLELRQRYTGTRLVWSGQWTSFSTPDFWVTVVGTPYQDPSEANEWCDAKGFAADDCFAKFISPVLGVEGTTVYRK